MLTIYAVAKDDTILGRVRWCVAVIVLFFVLIGLIQSASLLIQVFRSAPVSIPSAPRPEIV